MKTHTIVVVACLGVLLARPALAQTSGWDFSSRAPAVKDTAAPKEAAAAKETAVARKTPAAKEAASKETADSTESTPSSGWNFTDARPANAVKDSAAKPAPAAQVAAPAPSRSATPAAAHTATPAQAHAATPALAHAAAPAPAPAPRAVAAHESTGVHLVWGEPPAAHRAAPVASQGGAVLRWSTGDAGSLSPAAVEPAAVTAVTLEELIALIGPVALPPMTIAATPTAARAAAASTMATPVVAQAAKPIEPRRPQPTGLERLSDDWPKALKVGVQYRGRAEAQRGSAATNGRDDGYYLNRIRLEATVNIAPWLKGYAQVQDAQTLGYNVATQPASLTNTFDLRQGYVEARWPSANGFGVRVGRQEISFGDQRLVGGADWNNTARSFDAVRVFLTQPGVQVDAFVSSVVVIAQNAFDKWKTGETFSGTYVSLSRLVPKGVIEPYVLARFQNTVTGEMGSAGDGATYTFGTRAAGTLPRRFDYGVEVAAQRGHIATDAIDAWAGHYVLGWTIVPSAVKPRLVAEFNHASGDGDPRDGRRQTFDQLYPTNHIKYGIADQMGWRNMRDAMVGIELVPVAKLKVNADMHRMFLATTADGLYTAPGTQKVLNRKATSRTVGTEVDLQAMYAFSKELSFGAGVGTLFAGDYLAQSTGAGTVWTPYVMWNIKF